MKIAFDSQLFLKGNKTGIAWYADNLIKELAKDTNIEYICDYFPLGRSRKEIENLKIYEQLAIRMNPCPWFDNLLYKLICQVVPLPHVFMFGKNRDITIFFNYIIPPGVWGKKVVMVYDMAYKVYPQTVHIKTRKWLEMNLEKSCKRADLIITISDFSKNEILKYLDVDSKKIAVVPCGVDLGKYHERYSKTMIIDCMKKYKVKQEYYLYLGTLEPRKNIVNLIKAYDLVRKHLGKRVPQLVIAGGKGWYYEGIFRTVHEYQLQDNVIFTDYVPEDEVPLLMSGAIAFVFPSLYEGFGMPPLEAMACGTPVIVSKTASLPEVVGDAGILVNEKIPADIAKAMILIKENKFLRMQLQDKGRERVKRFTWEKSVKSLKAVLQQVIDNN